MCYIKTQKEYSYIFDSISYGIQSGYPFAKESPFVEPFKNALIKMRNSGILHRIWENNQIILDTQCEDRKVNTSVDKPFPDKNLYHSFS